MDRRATTGRARSATAVLAAAMLLAIGCAGHGTLELAPGDPEGNNLSALVDSEPARRLLADLLARRAPDPLLAALAPSLLGPNLFSGPGPDRGGASGRLPDQRRLRELGLEVSVDFAALAFAHAIGVDEKSRVVQAAFDRALRDGAAHSEQILRRPGAFPYTVLFAPAFLYRSHPDNGADFASQRKLLDRLGIANRLIEAAETASVEDNAATIAAAVREARRGGGALILVSTSKSGAEVALALSRLLEPEDAASVVGWLNAGGALRGTPLADAALRLPAVWFTRSAFWLAGWSPAGLASMATEPSRERLENARLPEWIAVLNLVAVPVSGSVGGKVYGSYRILRRHGPNDGVVMLADTVWPGGANLVALGADHLFASLHQDVYGLALLRAVDVAVRRHRALAGSPSL